MNESWKEQCHQLWDNISGFSATNLDDALQRLLEELASLIDAQNAYWMGTLRLSEIAKEDPLSGWRPRSVVDLFTTPDRQKAKKEHLRQIYAGQINPTHILILEGAGSYRITMSHEIAPKGWYESEFYRTLMAPFSIIDTIYVVTPLGDDLESWFAFERNGVERSHFGEFEREVLSYAVRPLKWFHKQLVLHHGVMLADEPLKPAERRILNSLLTDMTEQEIAKQHGLSPNTVHTYCTRIFRKFNVRGRAGLTALWLGQSPTD